MSQDPVSQTLLSKLRLLERRKKERNPICLYFELTARCNNNCRHCCINLSSQDMQALKKELSFSEIRRIADEAVSLGSLLCLITGGEPLLREDFFDIYLYLKKKGFLIGIFTNATLITKKHVNLLQKYPPFNIEITVYGADCQTYEHITRNPGSFAAFMRGLNLLLKNGIPVSLKTMALKSNIQKLSQIEDFCRAKTKDTFRIDPFLNLRYDGNQARNDEIRSERLSPEEIVAIEKSNPERLQALKKYGDKLINPKASEIKCNHLFNCGTGCSSITIGYDGFFRLCMSLLHPDCIYNLRKGTFSEAWKAFIPHVRNMRSTKEYFLNKCHRCQLFNLCIWCPGNAYLETKELDRPVEYFCKIAHIRAGFITKFKNQQVLSVSKKYTPRS